MATQRSQTTDDDRRVVPFRRRDLGASGRAPRLTQQPDPPNEAFSQYEGGGEREDTYRHRMVVNLAALAFTIVLALAGVWLAMQIADMRKNQDCLLSGRRNCAPIDVHALER